MDIRKIDASIYEIPTYKVLPDKLGNPIEVEVGKKTYDINELIAERDALTAKIEAMQKIV